VFPELLTVDAIFFENTYNIYQKYYSGEILEYFVKIIFNCYSTLLIYILI